VLSHEQRVDILAHTAWKEYESATAILVDHPFGSHFVDPSVYISTEDRDIQFFYPNGSVN
jgi:hypothetical protein